MSAAIKRMGIYNALKISSIQFNSAVFRCVIGVLAGVPLTTVATITAIERILNFILEVPTGRFADKYGRIPCAIMGHIAVILGLSCGYIGLIVGGNSDLAEFLFICHGIFIGITSPLISGSVEAFYQDAIQREQDSGLHNDAHRSFTLSKAVGKYFTTIAIIVAFTMLYILNHFEMSHHAFLLGILLWGITLGRLVLDYKNLGDQYSIPSSMLDLVSQFKNKRVIAAIFYNISIHLISAIIGGYFLISIGRELGEELGETQSWILMFLFFLSSQGLGAIIRGYTLPVLIKKVSLKNYITLAYFCLATLSVICLAFFKGLGFITMCIMAMIYGIFFFVAASAIRATSNNMLLKEVPQRDYAMVMSVYNMPGFLCTSGYSFYLIQFDQGAPSLNESFISVAVLTGVYLIFHIIFFKGNHND